MLEILYCCWPRCTVNRSRCYKKGGQHVQVHKNQEYVQLYTDVESNYFLLLSQWEIKIHNWPGEKFLLLLTGVEFRHGIVVFVFFIIIKIIIVEKAFREVFTGLKNLQKTNKRYDWLRRLNFKKVYFMLIEGLLLWKNQQLE